MSLAALIFRCNAVKTQIVSVIKHDEPKPYVPRPGLSGIQAGSEELVMLAAGTDPRWPGVSGAENEIQTKKHSSNASREDIERLWSIGRPDTALAIAHRRSPSYIREEPETSMTQTCTMIRSTLGALDNGTRQHQMIALRCATDSPMFLASYQSICARQRNAWPGVGMHVDGHGGAHLECKRLRTSDEVSHACSGSCQHLCSFKLFAHVFPSAASFAPLIAREHP